MPDEKPVQTEETTTTVAEPLTTPPVSTATNALAIASMIVGIVAFLSGWVPFWGLLTGIAAVVLGIIALKKPTGKGFSITGIITGGLAALTGIFATIFLIISLAATAPIINNAQNQMQKESEQSQDMINSKKNFAKGETAVFGTLEVKVNSVQRNYVPESSFYQADDGKEYVVVNVSVKNIGEEGEYISPYTFSLNDNGVAVENTFVTVNPELTTGNLSPEATVTGNLVFEVTKDSPKLNLQYETTAYTDNYESKKLIYTLGL